MEAVGAKATGGGAGVAVWFQQGRLSGRTSRPRICSGTARARTYSSSRTTSCIRTWTYVSELIIQPASNHAKTVRRVRAGSYLARTRARNLSVCLSVCLVPFPRVLMVMPAAEGAVSWNHVCARRAMRHVPAGKAASGIVTLPPGQPHGFRASGTRTLGTGEITGRKS